MREHLRIEDVPEGLFHDQLAVLEPGLREAVMEQLVTNDVPVEDAGSLRVFPNGTLYYACGGLRPDRQPAKASQGELAKTAAASSDSSAEETARIAEATLVSAANVPAYHSKPGAANVLFIDFNGMTVSKSTEWGKGMEWKYDQQCYAFSLDDDDATFTQTELDAIARIWLLVAEDYAPFDVDVTTAEPSGMATNNRVAIALITRATGKPYKNLIQDNPAPDAGGVAILGGFGGSDYANAKRPVFIYHPNMSDDPFAIAYGVSHEIGHNMNLSHDGTIGGDEYYPGHGKGVTSWAPIMGAGYRANVVQWSKGQYYNANNTEDDIAILKNKLGLRPDEDSNTTASARAVSNSADSATATGYIGVSGDADLYKLTVNSRNFQLSVSTLLDANGANAGNLDVRLDLLDASGNLVASASPEDVLTAALNQGCAKDSVFYVRISGSWTGNPMAWSPTGYSDYGCIGAYTLKITYDRKPFILTDLSSAIVSDGGSVTLSVVADGATTYKWYRDSDDVAGSGSSLTLDAFGKASEGFYTVIASNNYGKATSTAFVRYKPASNTQVLYTIGANNYGQTGDGDTRAVIEPRRIADGVVEVKLCDRHLFYLTSDNELYAAGINQSIDVFPDPTVSYSATPVRVATNVARMGASEKNLAFLSCDGTLTTAGTTEFNGGKSHPVLVNVKAVGVECGYEGIVYRTFDGALHGTGDNSAGRFGSVTEPDKATVIEAYWTPGNQFLVANEAAGCTFDGGALAYWKADQTLNVLGGNTNYVLGGYVSDYTSTPVTIASGVTSASMDRNNLYWLTAQGKVYGIGTNLYEQLARWDTQPVLAPTLLANGMRDIQACNGALLMIDNEGTLFRLGSGARGMLLGGHSLDSATPVECARNVVAMSGDGYTAALVIDETGPAGMQISSYPQIGIYRKGERVELTVGVSGGGTLTYQWLRNGFPLDGQTGASLVIDSATTDDAGMYCVDIHGSSGERRLVLTPILVSDPDRVANLYGMGYNSDYAFGNDIRLDGVVDHPRLLARNVLSIAGGVSFTVTYAFVTEDGTLYEWNASSDGVTTGDLKPITEGGNLYKLGENVVQVAYGQNYLVYLTTAGDLYWLGYHPFPSPAFNSYVPEKVASNVAFLSPGDTNLEYLTREGQLVSCDSADCYQGCSEEINARRPIRGGLINVSTSGTHSLQVDIDGNLFLVPYGHRNELFSIRFARLNESFPLDIEVTSARNRNTSMAYLKRDRSLMVMGYNYPGMLGLGPEVDWATTPTCVATNVRSCRYSSSILFLDMNNRLWLSGYSTPGIFQTGDTSLSYTPQIIAYDVADVAMANGLILLTSPTRSAGRISRFAAAMQLAMPAGMPAALLAPHADADGDGVDNLTEYAQGTNPAVPDAQPLAFRFAGVVNGAANFTLPLKCDARISIRLEGSDDLLHWRTVFDSRSADTADALTQVSFTDDYEIRTWNLSLFPPAKVNFVRVAGLDYYDE